MKIKFVQSGGVAGLSLVCEIDTRMLPGDNAAEIENLVRIGGIQKSKFTLPRIVACDILYYSISVKSNEVSYHVEFDDFTIPERGRPLLDYLKQHARPEPL